MITINSLRAVGYLGGSTDQKYVKYMLPKISDYVPVKFEQNENLIDTGLYLGRILLSRFGNKIGITIPTANLTTFFPPKSGTISFGYGTAPQNQLDHPFIYWETFCPPTILPERIHHSLDEYRSFHKHAVELSDLIITPLGPSAEAFSILFPHKADRVRVIPFFIPHLSDYLSLERSDDCSDERVKLLFVGSDARRKGLIVLLDAWKMLPASIKAKSELRIVSMFRDGNVLLPDDVIYQGFTKNPAKLFIESDVFVLPTLEDSFGFVLVEAMAAGCAVVTTDDPIRRDIVGDGNGLFAAINDPEKLAERLTEIIENNELRRSLAVNGKSRVKTVFAPQFVATKLYECFKELS